MEIYSNRESGAHNRQHNPRQYSTQIKSENVPNFTFNFILFLTFDCLSWWYGQMTVLESKAYSCRLISGLFPGIFANLVASISKCENKIQLANCHCWILGLFKRFIQLNCNYLMVCFDWYLKSWKKPVAVAVAQV